MVKISARVLAIMLLIGSSAIAQAAVIASVDRSRIDLNESFTLKVTVDTAIDTEPDASALEEDFYVQQRSQLSNTTIVNGQITRSRTWSYVLMAKRSGDLTIPPVIVGSERSEPVQLTVSPQSDAIPGEADIFVITEVDFDESYVQAQILYVVKVYRAVATRQPRLSEPEISGIDVLVESAGEERAYESVLNDKSYAVNERVYALFPQESGEIRIDPARFEARVLRNGRISGRKVFQSEPMLVDVKPIPPPPDSHPDAAWLPAKTVTISEEWSRPPASLPAGEPITRRLTVAALGQISTQIPVVDMALPDSLKVYPDKPELKVSAEPGGIRAARTDQYAMIGVAPGVVEMPPIELPWWDIGEGEWKFAQLGGRSVEITPSADALPPTLTEPAPAADDAGADETSASTAYNDFWRRISGVLGVLWLLTVLTWWWSGSARQKPVEAVSTEPPTHKKQSRLLKTARNAAAAGDTAALKTALLKWAKLEWPRTPPRSVGDLAERVHEPAATELKKLARHAYGPTSPESWDGTALAAALNNVSAKRHASEATPVDDLPPLMPSR